MTRRTHYHIAGISLPLEMQDAAAAAAVDGLFAGWYLAPAAVPAPAASGPWPAACEPAIVVRSAATSIAIPPGFETFDVADGVCHTDGRTSYIIVGGSTTAINVPGRAAVDVSLDGPPPLGSTELTRTVSYALGAALRQRRRFQLHSGALIDPQTGEGVLLIGPSGSGKSTLTVHLATAGWPFLTDDVILLGQQTATGEERNEGAVTMWPLRRAFAVTAETFAASRYLQSRTTLERLDRQIDDKRQFAPDLVFARAAERCAVPATLIFTELTGAAESRITPLPASDTMARLIRLNPWACYDRATSAAHLSTLAALTTRTTAYALRAGHDLLDPDAAVRAIAACTRASSRRARHAS